LTFLAILKGLIAFVIPIITRKILEIGETGILPGMDFFLIFLAALGGLYIVNLTYSKFILNFALSFKTRESKLLFQKLMEVELSYINKKGPTYFATRIIDSLEHIFSLVGSLGANFIVASITIAASLFLIYSINKTLFLLFIILLPLSYLSYKKLNLKLLHKTKKMQQVTAVDRQNIINITQNIFAFKQMFNYSRIAERLKSYVYELNAMNRDVSWYAQVLSNTIQLLINIIKNAIIFLTVYYYLHQQMMISELVFINLIMSIYFTALTNLNSLNINKRDMKAAIDFIQEEILNHLEVDDGKRVLEHVEEIRFDIKSFDYENGQDVLKNIGLKVEKPVNAAITGEAGCGKSTLLKLLGRFYKSDHIRINGENIKEYTMKSLREKIYYSPQDSYIVPGTVIENITIGLEEVDRQRLDRVLHEPFLANFLKELPHGMDTVIGENSLNLSGGQRQKILIARALMRNPDVLILDESTSSIDSSTEESIYQTIYKFFPTNIIIKISHRLSTVADSDLIVVMKEGRIIARGNHMNLLRTCAQYRKIFATQMNQMEVQNYKIA
jgi:ABC-type bacteriocin/lantibiotic exporter with double-glycine peptidase domain